jgi:hypothetical protein
LLLLAPCRRCDRSVRGLIGDALEGIGDPLKLKRDLIGAARAPQYHNVLAAEIKRAPKQQTNENRPTNQQELLIRKGD